MCSKAYRYYVIVGMTSESLIKTFPLKVRVDAVLITTTEMHTSHAVPVTMYGHMYW